MRRLALALAVAALLGAACGDDGGDSTSPEPEARSDASTSTTSAPETTPTTARPSLGSVSVQLEEVARLDSPIALAVRPGVEPLFVAERGGTVRALDGGEVSEPLVDISGDTTTDGERGLLGLTFSPDGGFLYLSYTNDAGDSRLDEYAMGAGPTEVDVGSRREVLAVDQPFANHNGGHVVFGPDGLLYYGLGDGGAAGDPDQRAQDTGELLGKVLRIDPRPSGSDPYAIPADNPFAAGGGRGEIFLYGVRNPWRFSFDREGGDLWIGDVGQGEQEEVDRLALAAAAGANLGWDRLEGTLPFEGEAPADAVAPVFTYGRDDGYSVTGGFVYRGSAIPGLVGAYVFGDYGAGELQALEVENGAVVGSRSLGVEVGEASLVSFAEDADGELLVLGLDGPVYRLVPG
ncbi:MAG: PQQ-dependent sugar dehydrogenase [Acidimicrobiia bacterium]|nr:PQQ-dependent sugar dehydrogenase [Acidimicrobiia bacterium]